MTKRAITIYLLAILFLLTLVGGYYAASFLVFQSAPQEFSGARAFSDIQQQLAFGPRVPSSEGHLRTRKWIVQELESAGWEVDIHASERLDHAIYNIIARRDDAPAEIILGAHYDTRLIADQDSHPDNRALPVPGANDGASGVAILLELARTLPEDTPPIWLVFFDAEDNGRIPGWDWILGSRTFVEEVPVQPQAVVIVDMVGDADLNLYLERNSNPQLRSAIWATAAALGHEDIFINKERHSMLDDHTPFLEAGFPAVDIIDFDYEYWHTTQDTIDKVSAESLQVVGETLWNWVVGQPR